MAYLEKWRRRNAELHAIALGSDLSSEEDELTVEAVSEDLGEELDDAGIEDENIVCDDQQSDRQ